MCSKYIILIKDLLSGSSINKTSGGTELAVTLNKNTPYSWYVVSKSGGSSEAVTSEVWKFYNSGPGEQSYTPYPAEAVSPLKGETLTASNNKITLKWAGSDVDGDIAGYDVYFGTSSTPPFFKSGTENTITDISVSSGARYYWKVTTKDSKGNKSESELFWFKTN